MSQFSIDHICVMNIQFLSKFGEIILIFDKVEAIFRSDQLDQGMQLSSLKKDVNYAVEMLDILNLPKIVK